MRLRAWSVVGVVLGVVAGVVGLAAPGSAGPPGTWTVVSGGGVRNIVQPGLYRTGDGTLHVAMNRQTTDLGYIDVAHISPTGKFTSRTDATGGWEGVTVDPALVGSPDGGIRMVFGGIHSTDPADPYIAGYLWQTSASASGLAWTLSGSPAVAANTGYASSGSDATTLADGTLVSAYAGGSTIYYQVGAGAPQTFDIGAGNSSYYLALAQDAGVVYAAWYVIGDDASRGQFVRTIYPTLGPVTKVPGSTTDFGGHPGSVVPSQRLALASRVGGGVYMALCKGYPTCGSVVLWKVGAGRLLAVPGSKGARHVDISAGQSGRLWVAFDDASGVLHAARTDPGATQFGALRTLKPPGQADASYDVAIEGSRVRADLLFNDGERIWHQQLYAGLTLKATPARWNGDKSVEVTFKVTDAGDGVQGAKVKAKWNGQSKTCTTSGNGKCKMTFPRMGRTSIKVEAKKSRYAPDDIRLKVT